MNKAFYAGITAIPCYLYSISNLTGEMAMNKYYRILDKILVTGKTQTNKKGSIQYLLNEQLSLTPADLLDIFEGHNIARKKLRSELQLFMQGERNVEKYREAGIN